MPNHIQNRLSVIGNAKRINEMFEFIKGEDNAKIDFNTIVPQPEIMRGVEPHSGIIDAVNIKYEVPLNDNPSIAMLERMNREKQTLDFEGEDKIMFDRCCKTYKETGFASWYKWSIANWGTKWNAYGTPDDRDTTDTTYFQTAWSNVHHLIILLSLKFKDLKFLYDYADEDTGSNIGRFKINSGVAWRQSIEENSKEAYELAFELSPDCKEYYVFNGTTYDYVEED